MVPGATRKHDQVARPYDLMRPSFLTQNMQSSASMFPWCSSWTLQRLFPVHPWFIRIAASLKRKALQICLLDIQVTCTAMLRTIDTWQMKTDPRCRGKTPDCCKAAPATVSDVSCHNAVHRADRKAFSEFSVGTDHCTLHSPFTCRGIQVERLTEDSHQGGHLSSSNSLKAERSRFIKTGRPTAGNWVSTAL